MNHLEHFGFAREPFSLSPATLAFYNSAQHAGVVRTVSQMVDGREQYAVVQGAAGSGKTTVAYQIISQLSAELYGRAYVACTAAMKAADVAALVGLQLSGETAATLAEALDRCESEQLLVILDDADRLAPAVLNALLKSHRQAKFLLLGCDVVKIAGSLGERTLLINLGPLSDKGTVKYVKNRLRGAGGDSELFEKDAIAALHDYSGGNPAAINLNCERLLVMAAAANAETVSGQLARAVLAVAPATEAASAPPATATVGMTFEDEPTMDAASDDFADRELAGAVSVLDELANEALETEVAPSPKQAAAASAESASKSLELSDEDSADLDSLLGEFEAEVPAAAPAPSKVAPAKPKQVESVRTKSEIDDFAALADATAEDKLAVANDPEGGDVEDLLAEFEASEGEPEAASADQSDDDLDSLLADLDQTPSAPAAPAPKAAAKPAATAKAKPAPAPAEEDELDTLLGELQAEESVASKNADDNDADVDSLLKDLESESEVEVSIEAEIDIDADADVDALLGDLEADAGAASKSGEADELDALLDQLEDKPSASAKAAADPAAKATAAKPAAKPASKTADSELDDLLSQIDELQDI